MRNSISSFRSIKISNSSNKAKKRDDDRDLRVNKMEDIRRKVYEAEAANAKC